MPLAVPGFDGPLLGGRYKLGPKLGNGSQGDIFLAVDLKAKGTEDREVIVKRLLPRGHWKSFELFEREAKVLSQLRHSGVPRHFATLEEPPGTFNLVMQRVPGENLRDLFARRRLSELQLRDVLLRTLEILDYLHTRVPAVVHRDLKPSNLVRAPDGKIGLVDFGGVLDAPRDQGGSTIIGTFGYMAPEQLHGQATPATDIYALGCTIVALAGGVEPEAVPRKGLRMNLAKHLPALDPALRATLEAMTDPDPEKRPQRARDVVALLASAHPKGSTKAPPSSPVLAPKSLVKSTSALPARKLFADIPEPLATFFRLGVLGVGAGGYLGMAAARLSVTILLFIAGALAFPARTRITHVRHELDSMLSEGQTGFADMCRGALARH
jgi:serine/threonine protein kinase